MQSLSTMLILPRLLNVLLSLCLCGTTIHMHCCFFRRDCPIFYRRMKVKKDLQDAQSLLERFALSW